MKICVVGGAGYVGLITGTGFALLGHDVVGVDVDERRVALLSGGVSPILEEGLDEALRSCLDSGRLRFTTVLEKGAKDADVVFLAVGSPAGHDGQADITQLRAAVGHVAEVINPDAVVVIKSTVPVGAMELITQELDAARGGSPADVAVNPEFLREGQGLKDFFSPSRIVVGTESERALAVLRELYEPFTEPPSQRGPAGMDMAGDVPFIATSVVDAQLIKYAANAFLAMRVSFINELASICERVGGDVRTVAAGLGYDPRIGPSYLQAGIGFGGPCLEKDLMALIQFADKAGYEPGFLKEVLARNDRQVQSIVDRTAAFLGNDLSGKRIAVLGLAFKPGTNDVRTSLSVRIIQSFTERGASVVAHDPVAIEDAEALGLGVEFDHDALSASQGAAALLVLTDWPEYQDLDWGRVAEAMAGKDVVDGRNCLDAALLADAGLVHHGIGR